MRKRVICAGHACIDITPTIPDTGRESLDQVLQPGKLLHVGPAEMSLGGSVSNTGIGMKVLGADVTLAAKIGRDAFGDLIESRYRAYGAEGGLIRQEKDATAYSVVLAIPGIDRIFLHHPGANDTFTADDLDWERISDAALFHFGYPPLMRSMFLREGDELVRVFEKARSCGMATSLDFAAIDPDSEAGRADWRRILQRVLPLTDFFVPSIEELCYMLDKDRLKDWKRRAEGRDVCEVLDPDADIRPLADVCMDLGCKVLLIKCGSPGLYLRTGSGDLLGKISGRVELDTEAWAGQDFFETSYRPDRILSGTGAGDTSIAAFLTSMLEGDGPDWAARYAAATGACCITQLDAISGLLSLPELKKKILAGWDKNR